MVDVVVTGAGGYLGSRVVRELAQNGGHHVCAVDRETDLRDDVAVRDLIARARPEVIVHLGAVSGPMVSAHDPALVAEVNVVGTVNVMQAASELRAVPRVLLASSVAALEDPPGSIYAVTKRAVEDVAALYRRRGLEVSALRIGSLYGDGRATSHVISDMVAAATTTREISYVANAEEPLVHVDDAAHLVASLVETSSWNLHYDVVQGIVAHRDLAFLVARLLGYAASPEAVHGAACRWSPRPDGKAIVVATGEPYLTPIDVGVADWVKSLQRGPAARR